ncbi:phosphatase [Aminipila butyrica]|uniref:Phosphatase n=1 Tax=Aminipila butyrica TaxID=433296 RepID=A0A858BRP5_9FIRM|nr:phosphatase [Aminipila butyrica]QIB67992.1 phosphatase [Aminipila butyrica]
MYGVIDIGSNTIRLAVYEVENKEIKLLFNKKSAASLASYVDKEGALSTKGIHKAISVLKDFKIFADNLPLAQLFVFATASLRNITNSESAVAQISQKTGLAIDLVSGEQEGIYDFFGVSLQTQLNTGLLIDIGGGSTEFVVYQDGVIEKSVSIPIGSLNLHKKYVKGVLPSQKEVQKICKRINKELETISGIQAAPLLYGVGGTLRAACKLNNQLFDLPSDCNKIKLKSLQEIILGFSGNARIVIQKMLESTPERIHTIFPGILILHEICKKFDTKIIYVSSYGIREGYLFTKLFSEEDNHVRI